MSNIQPPQFRGGQHKSQYRQQARIFRGHRNSQQNGNAYLASNPKETFTCKNHAGRQLETLNKLRQDNRFCDINIMVQDKVFPAHWVVLAAASPYFEAMFRMNFKETQTNATTLHEIQDADVFDRILNFIYKGSIEVTQENCQFILAAANMLQLPDVVDFCCKFLNRDLHPSNCVGIFRFAELHSCIHLKVDAKRFIERRFTEVIKEDEFLHIPYCTMLAFLKSEALSIDNEYQVFDALMTWILFDVEERRQFVFELLPEVRIAVMSSKKLDMYLEKCPDQQLREDIRSILQDYRIQLRNSGLAYDVRLKPRMCARKSVYIIGGNHIGKNQRQIEENALQRVERLDTFRGVWTQEEKMIHARSGHGTAILENLIYVVGGAQSGHILADTEVFDPSVNEWSPVAPLNQARTLHGVCAADGSLFAIGGLIGTQHTASIERYNPITNSWILLDDSMSSARAGMGVASHCGMIYIVGGRAENGRIVNSVERYNPATGEIVALPCVKNPRTNMGIAVLHDYIYVVGGIGIRAHHMSSVERYSIKENTWCEILPLRRGRAGCAAAAVDNKLYVIGGRVAPSDPSFVENTLDTVELYDPERNKWMDSNNTLPISRCDAAITVM